MKSMWRNFQMAILDTSKIKKVEKVSGFSWADFDGLENLETKLDSDTRMETLSRVGKLLSGLPDEYLVIADDVDDDFKSYVTVTKDTPEGKMEYLVVEDTLTEAVEKERKAIEKLDMVKAIPECDEKYIAKMIEQTGGTAEDIVGEYLDNLSTFLLNEQGDKPKSKSTKEEE